MAKTKIQPHIKIPHQEELFHLLVDRVRDYAIFFLDPNGHVASWNAGAALLKGYTAGEIIGESIERFYQPEDVAAGIPAKLLERAKAEGQAEIEGWRIRKNGTRFWADVVVTAVRDADGNLLGYGKVTRDLTEQRQAQETLRQAHSLLAYRVRDLARSNADLEQFAYVASHDLQEPIRMIITHVQLLNEEYKEHLQGDAQEYVRFVLEGARRMQRLVKDLLTYSRVVRTDQPFSSVNCEVVLQQALDNLGVTVVESRAVITHDPLPTLHGNTSQLIQLFQNLIGNAIKFRRQETPRIHIGVSATPTELAFRFQDNGIGIEKKYAEQIFLPFRRLHTNTQYPGSGIGLAICQKVAEHHGGRISVQSTLGQGSTFTVALKREHRTGRVET